MLRTFLDPNLPIGFEELSRVILPVAVTLLGLVYAGLIYWFQGAIDRLKYASDLIEGVISTNGKVVLDLLVGAGLVSLCGAIGAASLAAASFWIAAILLTVDVARLELAYGYIETVSTTKSIPRHLGPFRRRIRQIRNAGAINWTRGMVVFLPTVIYPIAITLNAKATWRMTPESLNVFLLTALALSLVRVRSLLLEALQARDIMKARLTTENQERARELDEPAVRWDNSERQIERKILVHEMEGLGVVLDIDHPDLRDAVSWTSRDLTDAPVLLGAPDVREGGTCHINIVTPDFPTAEDLRMHVFSWARRVMRTLAHSKTRVHFITLSFFRSTSFDRREHISMLRATRPVVINADEDAEDDIDFVRRLSGVFVSGAISL